MSGLSLFAVFTDNDTVEVELDESAATSAVLGGSVLKISTVGGGRAVFLPLANLFYADVKETDGDN